MILPKDKDYRARIKLVDTAAELFYRQGYTATGINQIIAEAGVAKASLYQHFTAKEELLVAYLEQAITAAFVRLRAQVLPLANPRDQVLACFSLMAEFMDGHDFRGCRFQNMLAEVPASSPRVHELIQQHSIQMRDFFAELLLPIACEANADSIALLYEGALISCQIHRSLAPIETAKKIVASLL
ncbi:TetR/AcrR family transcriptional regulator [Hymenobacter terricola]|uniref:TetR/AcrR family transcriptional regulator n=1 Tax=Hymenobacter terricola TaxID=2819236 RepID=UPI001B310EB1|nr:TetR/AcrR family transcriptional regulator [Hymenobacter terricola]